jgi:nucleoside-diphosphate kinase
MAAVDERYVFFVEWYDQPADLVRKYSLTYYSVDDSIDMVNTTQYDLKNRRVFLKRTQCPGVSMSDLFIGATVTVYARQLKVVEYGDVFTRQKFEQKRSRTFGMIKPDCYTSAGKIIQMVIDAGFRIANLRMHRFTRAQAEGFYAEHRGKSFYNDLIAFMTSDVVIGLELVAEDAVLQWRRLIGPTNANTARTDAPRSIRALFGEGGTKNAVHGSDSPASAAREVDYFFNLPGSPAVFSNSTCCIVKPHSIGSAGRIIDTILEEGFEISAMQLFYLDKPTAEEFFEVYKGVLPEFVPMVDHATAGPCIAMEVRQENAVQAFRELCGPMDPEVARNLRPNTLRAKYGIDRVQNAVHCSDLPEDGSLEAEYFFKILSSR